MEEEENVQERILQAESVQAVERTLVRVEQLRPHDPQLFVSAVIFNSQPISEQRQSLKGIDPNVE